MNKRNLELLLREKYGYSESEIFLFFNEYPNIINNFREYKNDTATDVFKDLKLINKEYPIDYIIGYKHFGELYIDLSLKPLIPRPETEHWVSNTLQGISPDENSSVLDIFSGSGCIGLYVMSRYPTCQMTFADIKNKSIKQILINIEKNKFLNRNFEIVKSDLFKKIRNRFDYIFANPPYISYKDNEVGNEIKYEPGIALYTGDNGLKIIKEFLTDASNYLKQNGQIYMEFGSDQKDLIDDFLREIRVYKEWEFNKDQFGKWRWVRIIGK